MVSQTCLMLTCASLLAGAIPRADDPPIVDKKTGEILKKVGVLYKDAKSLHADAAIETTVENEGQDKRDIKIKATFDWERPNHFAMRSKHANDENAGLQVICDGKTLFVHAKRLKQYTEDKAPADLGIFGRSFMRHGHLATGMLFQNIVAEDPEELLLDGVTKGQYVGTETVNGKLTHHCKFKQEGFDWELWIAADGDPWVLKAKSDHPTESGGRMVTTETYTNWKRNAETPKDAFAFKAPDGVEKVKVLRPRVMENDKAKDKDG